jgi:hypothetical protein
MTAIVMNTMTGAVSEYTGFDFHAITPTHTGSVNGLYELGGDLDVAALIVSNAVTGKTLRDGTLKKFVDMLFFAIKGTGTSTATVYGEENSYTYEFDVRANGESRCKPGRGLRENYFAFGYSNTDGAAFQLDRIEAIIAASNTRRS